MRGFAAETLVSGPRYVAIHYTADEEKQGEWHPNPENRTGWVKQASAGIPVKEWERDMEIREDVYEGEPVYADYRDDLHCPLVIRDAHIPIVPNSMYFGGWDCGLTLNPAFVLDQVTPKPFQVHSLLEVIPIGAMPMETFAPLVLQALMTWHPGLWDSVQHYGDETVKTRSGTRGETAQDVARKFGVNIKPVSNQWAGRYSAVTWLLTDMIDAETPRYYVSGKGCPMLRAGYKGAYKYEVSASGDQSGPGMVLRKPLKNSYSHIHDARQASAVAIKRELSGKTGGEVTSRRG